MRLKALKTIVAALALAGLGSAAAFALPQPDKHPHPGTTTVTTVTGGTTVTVTVNAPTAPTTTGKNHGKPPKTGVGCKPSVSMNVSGKAHANATPPTLQVDVSGGNHRAHPLFANHTTTLVTVTTNASTKLPKGGLASIKQGDRVLVKFRDCKAALDAATTAGAMTTLIQTPLFATQIVRLG